MFPKRIPVLTFASLLTLPVAAQDPPSLTFSVECILGDTCFIQQTMDRDSGPGARDFRCGPMTYNGHSGTDIRLPDRLAMAANIPVLAAAHGIALGTRDGIPDTGIGGFPAGQDCGNFALPVVAPGHHLHRVSMKGPSPWPEAMLSLAGKPSHLP